MKTLLKTRTRFTPVFIQQHGQQLHLKFNSRSRAIQTVIDTKKPWQLQMDNLQYLMGILMFIPIPKKILILGTGGGALIHFFRHYLPKSHITAVDLDSELIEISQQHLLLPQTDNKLEYHIADAKHYIKNCQQSFDLIMVDIFDDSQSPDWILEKDFNLTLKQCLSEKGAAAFNLVIKTNKQFSQFYTMLRQIYQRQTLCLEHEDHENVLVYASNQIKPARSMNAQMNRAMQLSQKYGLPMNEILSVIYSINPVESGMI